MPGNDLTVELESWSHLTAQKLTSLVSPPFSVSMSQHCFLSSPLQLLWGFDYSFPGLLAKSSPPGLDLPSFIHSEPL